MGMFLSAVCSWLQAPLTHLANNDVDVHALSQIGDFNHSNCDLVRQGNRTKQSSGTSSSSAKFE
jgi:hypothetical protein